MTHAKSILLIVLATLFTSSGQLFLKTGTQQMEQSAINTPLVVGFLLYLVAAYMIVVSFKNAELSVVYPVIATSYIWVSIGSQFFFDEAMNTVKWLGVGTIILGVALIGKGRKRNGSIEMQQHAVKTW